MSLISLTAQWSHNDSTKKRHSHQTGVSLGQSEQFSLHHGPENINKVLEDFQLYSPPLAAHTLQLVVNEGCLAQVLLTWRQFGKKKQLCLLNIRLSVLVPFQELTRKVSS